MAWNLSGHLRLDSQYMLLSKWFPDFPHPYRPMLLDNGIVLFDGVLNGKEGIREPHEHVSCIRVNHFESFLSGSDEEKFFRVCIR